MFYLQNTHFKYVIGRLKIKRWKTYHANTNQKKLGADILISKET